jgi:hypothetical protein
VDIRLANDDLLRLRDENRDLAPDARKRVNGDGERLGSRPTGPQEAGRRRAEGSQARSPDQFRRRV